MTTLDPGARVVLTQGLRARPFSTAFFASRAAPSITCGLEVLVQLVIEEITTAPWSSSKNVPSSPATRTRFEGRPLTTVDTGCGWPPPFSPPTAGESEAGKDSAPAFATSGPISSLLSEFVYE